MARIEFSAQYVAEQPVHGGAADALFELGLMYCTGRDVELDLIEAHKWFNLAALRGNEAAKSYRSDLSREMSRAEISAAQRRAREWLAVH
ncbi:MAG: sel1 repeat family protein [Hyphomicrobiaceae bacterium]|nr:sel1 repeat family protein [Hyphomicrobiaceae bacterium]